MIQATQGQVVKSYLISSSVQSQVSGNSLRTLTDFGFFFFPFFSMGVSVAAIAMGDNSALS